MKQLVIIIGLAVMQTACVASVDDAEQVGSDVEALRSCGGFMGVPCPGNLVCFDDRSDDCTPEAGGADCPGVCRSPHSGTPCGTTLCNHGETCCEGMPFRVPTCITSDICPISRAQYKTDIEYVDPPARSEIAQDLMSIPLATYRYKADGSGRRHLGFIIDDVEPTVGVASDGDHVDLYGYTSMAVAAVQEQQVTIDALRAEVAALRAQVQELGAHPARCR